MKNLAEMNQDIVRETHEMHQGRPLVLEVTKYGVFAYPKGRTGQRQQLSILGAWQSAQTRAARLPTGRQMGMSARARR